MWEVAWKEINRSFDLVVRRKAFRTELAREKFIDRLVEKSGFCEVIGYRDPA